jgi:signal transduction histidine kinase
VSVDSNDLLLAFLNVLPWPVILMDDTGRVLALNSQASNGDVRPIIQRRLKDLFPEYYDALGGDVPWPVSHEADVVRQLPRGVVYEHIYLRRLPSGACLIITDQTRQRELEMTDAQTARLASLGFMVAGVCHEISNPLTAIFSMVQILQSSEHISPDALEKGLANIAANVKRIIEISRRLAGFSRVDDQRRVIFRIDEAIDDALAILRHDRHFNNIEVARQNDEEAVILGHPGQLHEAFYNIFLNAVQAMGGHGKLSVATLRRLPKGAEVVIRDTGPGIAPEHLPRLFDPFFTTKAIGEGTGLGLSIANEILHEHGGEIRAENNSDGGACFRVDLPLWEGQR